MCTSKCTPKEITPMALDESAVSALLDALRVGEGTDLVRELAQWALQQLVEAEATAAVARGIKTEDAALGTIDDDDAG
jgi:hypothetical protein